MLRPLASATADGYGCLICNRHTDCQCNVAGWARDDTVGETAICEAIFDENQEPLEFPEGTKVTKDYPWS